MIVEVIPYFGVRERLQLMNDLNKQKCKVVIFADYLYIERINMIHDGRAKQWAILITTMQHYYYQ